MRSRRRPDRSISRTVRGSVARTAGGRAGARAEERARLGRVAILDRGESARRAVRAVRELTRAGEAAAAIALCRPGERLARFAREADEAVELRGTLEDALRSAGADTAWLGPATLSERADFAEACLRAGVAHAGPPAAALRRLAEADGVARLAADLGIAHGTSRSAGPGVHLVEVVVARDRHGTAHAIGIGDASLWLGPSAVLVESPAPALRSTEAAAARQVAIRACTAAGWVGVAAVRLLFDPRDRRLALEGVDAFAASAPAVEAAAGVELASLALRLAAGEAIEMATPPRRAHAFTARIVAGDPEVAAPAAGRLELLRLPSMLGVRAEAETEPGDDVTPRSRDALVTIVARGEDRAQAAERLEAAISETDVLVSGGATSKAWLRAVCARPEVKAGEAGLGMLAALAARGERLVPRSPAAALIAAAIDAYDAELDLERGRFLAEARRGRPRVGPSSGRTVELRFENRRYAFDVRQTGPDTYRIAADDGAPVEVRVERIGRAERRLVWNGRRSRVLSATQGLRTEVEVDGIPHVVAREPSGVVVSPVPAVVVAIPVVPGQRVSAGEPIARVESMKVEVVVPSPAAGVVREVLAVPNTQVDAGSPLARLEPAEAAAQAEPLPLAAAAAREEAAPRERYLAALDELRRLALGFDVGEAEARRIAAAVRDGAAAVPSAGPEVLGAENAALAAFADVQSLFSRRHRSTEAVERRPPLEELWRYLHAPEARGAGLTPGFLAMLERALAHYGVPLDAPGRDLEVALLRIQKGHERAAEQVGPILGILERRLAGAAMADGVSRGTLERLAEIGDERFAALADLARELRYRRFDQPALDRIRAAAYAQAEADLAHLPDAEGEDREVLVERLVACPQPLATLLVCRMAEAAPALRPRLVETLLRRYHRTRQLEGTAASDAGGFPCAQAEHVDEGRRIRLVACFARADDAAAAASRLAALAGEVPPDRDLSVELYLWSDAAPADEGALAGSLRTALAGAAFPRPVRRASFVLAFPRRGFGNQASQQHFTFHGGPEAWVEERRYRGVHPMLFRRLQLERLSKFDLERLPSVEDVYLYRGVARGNPKDERLFAAAEVREVTPVRDADGRVVQLPGLERLLHEALAGMRRFQARRPPHQRLQWNRVLLTVGPPLQLSREEVRALAERLEPATHGLGLEAVLIQGRIIDPATGKAQDALLRVTALGRELNIRWDVPTDRPLEPLGEYQQRVVQLRRRGLTHPFELARMLAPPRDTQSGVPPGEFVEHDLDAAGALAPVDRPPGTNAANIVAGVVRSFTDRHPEGMRRVVLIGDPSRAMGSLAEPECRRIIAAIDLAERLAVPLEWFAVSAGAKISMESGTENMDWISRVLRHIVEFTQRGGEINVVVTGINVGAQPYWNAEATMLMHTRGILVMTAGSAMVLTGKEALEYSGSVSAEDNEGIGGYDRVMGPNGQAQYQAESLGDAIRILLRHYDHAYVVPGERFPRRASTSDPRDRDVRKSPHGAEGGAGFETVGDVFSAEKNPDRKKPFDIRRIMAAAVDQDHPTLERWPELRGGETAVVWDAHLGGWPVCLIGIESRPLPRLEFVPADGPEQWSAGTLFPQSSKKIARAINAASGNRPVVVLANLSGFDGSPESMRRLQLEYGAEIGRAVVNFRGPIVFCVVSRYHGGAFVVFSKTLREDIEIAAVEGARASVIGGAPAAAVVFAREVETRTRKDARVQEAERASARSGAARAHLVEVLAAVRSEKVGEVAEEFDRVHTVERARQVGSVDCIIPAAELRPYLIDAVERGIARAERG